MKKPMSLDRRTVLAGGVATSTLVALAACAAEPEPVATTPPSATVEDVESPAELAGELLLGTTDEIMVGSGKKFMIDENLTILVTHPRVGVFRGFSATCTHSGCIVTGVQEDQIACGCHGARFDVETGEPIAGPARRPLGSITIEVRGTELYALI